MKAYGDLQLKHFGEGNKSGYTGIQLIETSCISFHLCEETNDAYIDIFSCKPYKIEDAVSVVKEYFKPQDIRISYLERQAPQMK